MLDWHSAHGAGGSLGLLEVLGAILAAALVHTAQCNLTLDHNSCQEKVWTPPQSHIISQNSQLVSRNYVRTQESGISKARLKSGKPTGIHSRQLALSSAVQCEIVPKNRFYTFRRARIQLLRGHSCRSHSCRPRRHPLSGLYCWRGLLEKGLWLTPGDSHWQCLALQ